ncbi:MAG: hypothetical protein JXR95_16640 [Deltaproteobacteria bacterium]|nr:hypothetical protein [Deltaproteobacteria bacterium]
MDVLTFSLISKFFKNRTVWVALVVNIVVALLNTRVPLFNLMDYESSFVLAIIHSITGLLVSGTVIHRITRESEGKEGMLLPLMILSGLFTVPAFLIMLFSSIISSQCAICSGLQFFFMYVVLSTMFSFILGYSISLIFKKTRYVLLSIAAIFFAFIGMDIFRFFTQPPIFFYGQFYGFFSGAFYDQLIEIKSPFYYSRISDLFLASAVFHGVIFFKKLYFKTNRNVILVVFLASLVVFSGSSILSHKLGYRYTRDCIEEILGGKKKKNSLTVVYSTDIPEWKIEFLYRQAVYDYETLHNWFRLRNKTPLKVFIFKNRDQKRKLFGARNVEVAKPHLKEIYITADSIPHRSMRHEMAHVLAGYYTDSFFKVATKPLKYMPFVAIPDIPMIEGIAVAAAFDETEINPWEKLKILKILGLNANISRVFTGNFYALPSQIAYTVAGSFIRFLYTKFGPKAVFRWHAGDNFKAIFKMELEDAEKLFNEFLDKIEVDPQTVVDFRKAMSARSVHQIRCVHQVAREMEKASVCAANGNARSALNHIASAMVYDPENSDIHISFIKTAQDLNYTFLVNSMLRNARLQSSSMSSLGRREYLTSLRILEIQSYLKDGLYEKAREISGKTDESDIPLNLKRQIIMLKSLLSLNNLEIIKLSNYLFDVSPDKKETMPLILKYDGKWPLFHYMTGSMMLYQDKFEYAAGAFALVDISKLPDESFKTEYRVRYLKSLYLAGNIKKFVSEFNSESDGKVKRRLLKMKKIAEFNMDLKEN